MTYHSQLGSSLSDVAASVIPISLFNLSKRSSLAAASFFNLSINLCEVAIFVPECLDS